jgi:uracil-DNA glycosylase family 4
MRDSPDIDPSKAIVTSKAIRSSEPPASAVERDARVLAFWRRVNRCRECSTIAPWRKFPLGRRGTTRFGLMILGEAPGRVSLDNGRPFSNPRNLMIRRAFARAVAPRPIEPEQLCYFSDTVKCWPPSRTGANRSPSAAENSTCVERHLRRELELVRPRLIIAFGVRAAAAALGSPVKLATMHLHPVVTDANLRVIPLMHPSTINIAGMRRVGIRSLDDYEAQLVALFRREIADALARFDSGPV